MERQTQRRPRQTGVEMGAVHPEAEECRGFESPPESPEARRKAQNRPFLRVCRVSMALPHLDVGLPASRVVRINGCGLKSPSLWYCVTAALGNEQRQYPAHSKYPSRQMCAELLKGLNSSPASTI